MAQLARPHENMRQQPECCLSVGVALERLDRAKQAARFLGGVDCPDGRVWARSARRAGLLQHHVPRAP